MSKVKGKVVRARYANGDEWLTVSGERTSQIEVSATYVQCAGASRGVKLRKHLKSWGATLNVVLQDFGQVKDFVADFGKARAWSFDTGEQVRSGQGVVYGLRIKATNKALAEMEVKIKGDGALS